MHSRKKYRKTITWKGFINEFDINRVTKMEIKQFVQKESLTKYHSFFFM